MKKEVNRPNEEAKGSNSEDLPYNPEVTSEDKQALNEKGRSMNKGQDKDLDRKREVDFTAVEMDVPASNESKPRKKSELVDEENMQYNQKGARPDHKKSSDHPRFDEKI
ncbi:hypothetical protein GCM10023115_51880 [Pontixanthobacter gangjinensis]|uniref:Uncharacterized protein n=1 Tax=Christiangramia aestuarii TaxID=1028746 RepID=A0A7K1LPU8_9FLAO|nr:hypothetical protein [Christiangramia aestuarii]MUP42768.1 hypothetical protein [Christiangramia aestuarii]